MINFLTNLPFWLLISLSSIGAITGDFLAKYWSVHNKTSYFYCAILVYGLAGLCFVPVLQKRGLVLASILWSLIATIGFLVIGLIVFHEKLTTLQFVGVALGAVALIILAIDI